LTRFLSSFHDYLKYVKTGNLQCDNDKPFSVVACLPTTHLVSAKHITAHRILNFILRAKDV